MQAQPELLFIEEILLVVLFKPTTLVHLNQM